MKVVTGSYRADRDAKVNEDVPLGPMIAPLHLSEIARGHFATVAGILEEQKRSSPHYAEHVGLLALRLEQVARFQAVLDDEGDTYETFTATGGRMVRARPEVAMLDNALRHAQSLLGDLMLNPSAALKIATGHKQEAGDFDDF
ncbi:MAG: P27 family phage terminase small subunit [Sphingobium sp.]|nr:P27 family phage terminase small subunit [Sphingobium sp.]